MYNIMDQRKNYRIIVPLVSLAAFLLLFLPMLNIPGKDYSISGFNLFMAALSGGAATAEANTVSGFSDLLINQFENLRFIFILPVILFLAAAVLPLIAHKKLSYRVSTTAFIVATIDIFIMLTQFAKKVNVMNLGMGEYLVKNFGAGYWLLLIVCIMGITVSLKATKTSGVYIVLTILSIIWVLPIAWVVLISFRAEPGSYTPTFLPKSYTLDNYKRLFTETDVLNFPLWFKNTFLVAICSCIVSSFFVLSVSYSMSRMRFKLRKPFMNVALILGMFPGFMSMIAVYYILKAVGLTEGPLKLVALVLVYSGGAGLGFFIAKGFFDTIPKTIDEAAMIDGANRFRIFTKITIPLSKPIIVYTVMTSFMGPWVDYIFARVIAGTDRRYYTVAIGLWNMLEREYIYNYYTRFAAGSVCIAIPIAILFLSTQKYYSDGLSGAVKG